MKELDHYQQLAKGCYINLIIEIRNYVILYNKVKIFYLASC